MPIPCLEVTANIVLKFTRSITFEFAPRTITTLHVRCHQRKRKADGDFAIYKDDDAKRPVPSEPQGDEIKDTGRLTVREKASRDTGKKVARETMERLKRCTVPPPDLPEYDADDRDDPSSCAEYLADMYKHYKELEVKTRHEMRIPAVTTVKFQFEK